AAFDAPRCEQMPQVVMCDAIGANLFACTIKCLLAFADAEHFSVQRLTDTFAAHSLKQPTRIGNQRNTAQFPILCGRFGVAPHNDFALLEIQVTPFNFGCFTLPAAGKCQSTQEVCAISRTPSARVFYHIDDLQKLVTARECQLLCAYWHTLQVFRRVAVD